MTYSGEKMTEPTQVDIERVRETLEDFMGCTATGVHLIECESLIPALAGAFAEVRAEERQRAEEALRDALADAGDEG